MIARRAVRYSTGYSPSWVHRISALYSAFIAFSRCRGYFIRRVHGQLRKADVDCIQCHMAAGNVAQCGAAQHIGPVNEHLQRYIRPGADDPEQPGGNGIGGVFLVRTIFDDHAAVHYGVVCLVGLFRVVGWIAWPLSAEATRLAASIRRFSPAPAPMDSQMRSMTSCRKVEPAPCLVVLPTSSLSKTAHRKMLRSLRLSASTFVHAQVHCRSSSLGLEMNSCSVPQTLPQIQKQVGSKDLLGGYPGGIGNQLSEGSGAGGLPVYRQHINFQVQGSSVVHITSTPSIRISAFSPAPTM